MHALVAVDADARLSCELADTEEGDQFVSIDFTDIKDQDAQSESQMYYMD